MAKKTKEVVEEVVEEKGEVKTPSGSVSVYDARTKNFIRSYSSAEHGGEYKELAAKFASKAGTSRVVL